MAKGTAGSVGFTCPDKWRGSGDMAALAAVVSSGHNIRYVGITVVEVIGCKMTILTVAGRSKGMACGTAFKTAVCIVAEGTTGSMWLSCAGKR